MGTLTPLQGPVLHKFSIGPLLQLITSSKKKHFYVQKLPRKIFMAENRI
jgi:hypothetical protein